jgi:sulfite reductase (NADPH) flavoprotein alpha-component
VSGTDVFEMPKIPYIPSSAPFTAEQRAWLNGYLTGLMSDADVGEAGSTGAQAAPAAPVPTEPLLIMYGSQTGTAEQLAKRVATEAGRRGFAPRVLDMNAYTSVDLKQERRLVLVTSTWGDGDPPDNALAFWNHLNSEASPKLEHLAYSVLALGDKNYTDFCGAGKKFDARLEQLGARRVLPRTDCDTDYESAAKAWIDGLWPVLQMAGGGEPAAPPVSVATPAEAPAKAASPVYGRTNPFPARLIANRKLNAAGSAKDTRHFEIALHGSGLSYEAGDALGVMPANCPALVEELLAALGCDGEEAVKDPQGRETSFRHALMHSYAITQAPASFVQTVAQRSADAALLALLDPAQKPALDKHLYGRELIDFLLAYPAVKFAPAEFIAFLRKLQPRLYSISSSPKAHPGEVHLTVAAVRYESHGRSRKGVCSTFLADRVETATPVPVFVQTSHGFRLPADLDRPVIMIGPGTGIAPFRAFLEERQATGAKGRNWLFFGDQSAATDFLYREQLEALQSAGVLTRLDTAFSRDQAEKIYVQNRMQQNAAELWAWLEAGAHLYVCGDAKRMAKDVDAALHQIIQSAGGRNPEQAAEYVQALKTDKRYQRDVY